MQQAYKIINQLIAAIASPSECIKENIILNNNLKLRQVSYINIITFFLFFKYSQEIQKAVM